MLYLATQYAWFLLAAFAMGWLMGWTSCTGRIQLSSGPLPYLVAVWLLVLVLTGLQGINGAAALWTETALLHVAAYLLGCVLASFARAALPSEGLEPAIAADVPAPKVDSEPNQMPSETAAREVAEAAAAPASCPQMQEIKPSAAKPARRKRAKQPKRDGP